MTPTSITEFDTKEEACTFRHEKGTGGWIFVPEDGGKVLLFSPEVTAWNIFHHPITKGRSGDLLGS